jgi:hypothetical protein
MFYKILGLILGVIGFLILKYFPDVKTYQHEGMTMSAILIGVIFILVGIGLLIFG